MKPLAEIFLFVAVTLGTFAALITGGILFFLTLGTFAALITVGILFFRLLGLAFGAQ